MLFDILIPAYNESKNLHRIEKELIPQLKKDGIHFNLIIINDGSDDDTGIIAEELQNRFTNIKAIHHSRNMGLGSALRTGYSNSTAEWIISLDADLSYSASQVINLVEQCNNEVDAIFGSPYMKKGTVEGVHPVRLFPSRVVSLMYSMLMVKRLTCWTGIFRAIKKDAINEITIINDGFDAVAEIAVKLVKKRFRIVEIPAILRSRIYGKSKLSLTREIKGHLKLLKKILFKELL